MKLTHLFEQSEMSADDLCLWMRDHATGVVHAYHSSFFKYISPGVFDISADVFIELADDEELPVQFRETRSLFSIKGGKSLKGCPRKVDSAFYVKGNASFEGAPLECNGVYIADRDSLTNIHKHFNTIHRVITIGEQIKSNILGILLIPNFNGSLKGQGNGNVEKACKILESCERSKKGVLEAQDKLEDAGLEEFAKL